MGDTAMFAPGTLIRERDFRLPHAKTPTSSALDRLYKTSQPKTHKNSTYRTTRDYVLPNLFGTQCEAVPVGMAYLLVPLRRRHDRLGAGRGSAPISAQQSIRSTAKMAFVFVQRLGRGLDYPAGFPPFCYLATNPSHTNLRVYISTRHHNHLRAARRSSANDRQLRGPTPRTSTERHPDKSEPGSRRQLVARRA